MNLDISLLTNLSIETALEAEAQNIDRSHHYLMATHVSEIVKDLKPSELPWVLASTIVFLLVENFQLQQQLLVK